MADPKAETGQRCSLSGRIGSRPHRWVGGECIHCRTPEPKAETAQVEVDPTPETTDAFCEDCLSLMVEDNGAGHLCPACDEHPSSDCGSGFPCSGFDGKPCVLNAPLGSALRPGSDSPEEVS